MKNAFMPILAIVMGTGSVLVTSTFTYPKPEDVFREYSNKKYCTETLCWKIIKLKQKGKSDAKPPRKKTKGKKGSKRIQKRKA